MFDDSSSDTEEELISLTMDQYEWDLSGTEVMMVNSSQVPLGCVFPFYNQTLLVGSPRSPDERFFPKMSFLKNKDRLDKLDSLVYRVLNTSSNILTPDERILEGAGSSFRLSYNTIGTVKHVGESPRGDTIFVSNSSPNLVQKILQPLILAEACEATFKRQKFTRYQSILKHLNGREWVDRDPETPSRRLPTQYNFSVLKGKELSHPSTDYLVPLEKPIDVGMEIAVFGYPTLQSVSKWLKFSYPNKTKRPLEEYIYQLFPFNTKCCSIGTIARVHESQIFSITCALFPGFSGSAVTTIDGQHILGFVIGSHPGNTYNYCISVHHPAFVGEYCRHVVPDMNEGSRERVRPWIERHKVLIQMVAPDVLKLFY